MTIITFLSDYGLEDEFVGVCHGVIASICPTAHVIDITHGVARHDVRAGALVLQAALVYMPVGVHLAVVDPGVGGPRRAVALRAADGRVFVGPDNGLLMPATAIAGGVAEAVDIGRSRYRLGLVSATFHGRDVFAPIAAHLAGGASLSAVGEPCDAAELVTLELSRSRLLDGALHAHAAAIDRFGNVELDAGPQETSAVGLAIGRSARLRTGSADSVAARFVRTFADVAAGEALLYMNSTERLTVALNQGDAAERLGVRVNDTVRITPA